MILALVILLLSNRDPVDVHYWPFGDAGVPLWAVVLGPLVLGFVLGMLFHLPGRMAAGRRAKRAEKRLAALEAARPLPPPIV